MSSKQKALFGVLIGVPSIIAFGYFTSPWAAVALFCTMAADNLSRS